MWCLFEALTALSLGSDINLLTDPFDSTAKVDTLLPLFLKVGIVVVVNIVIISTTSSS